MKTMALDLQHVSGRLAVCAMLACALGGCSTATAAGCGVGTVAGAALAGVAVAAASSDVDGGTVVLGGSMFGVLAGCSGSAVAEAIARSDEAEKQRNPYRHGWSAVSASPGRVTVSPSSVSLAQTIGEP